MSTPLRRSNVSRVVAESESSGYNSPVAGTPRKLPRQLDLDLEELDDVEFHLPPVEEPTLDSILNEADDEDELLSVDSSGDGGAVGPTVGVSAVQEEGGPDSCLLEQQPLFSPVDSEAQSVVSGGSGSQTSSIRTSRLARREALRREHGSVFRHVILKGISAQVTSASERAGAGLPSAIAAASFLAVGMSNGTVLLFDPGQVLRAVLGTAKEGEDLGMVSSLAFNVDSTRLLVGHVKGVLRMFDVISGKLLRTIVDAHLPGTAVIHVKFTDSPALALICDSSGSVFELSFKRRLGIRGYDYRCIFSGSRGEVVNIEPLLLSSTPPSHQEDLPPDLDGSLSLVAMASMTKVLVVSIRPELEVLFSQSLPGDQGLLPLLSWRFVLIQSRVKVVDPVLAFGRQDVIYFYQVTVCSSPYPDFIPLQAVPLPFATIGFSWLNNRTLAVLDSKELLHVVDIRSQEEVEILDLSSIEMIYGSSSFKGLATGGNVSPAMAMIGERACFYSIACVGNQLLFVGRRSVHVLAVRTWTERIDHLVANRHPKEAIALAMSFYQEKGKAVVGLSGSKKKRKESVAKKLLSLILSVLEDENFSNSSSSNSLAQKTLSHMQYCKDLVGLAVEYLIILGRSDVLFGSAWDLISPFQVAKDAYLEALEPFVLNEEFVDIPPQIVQEYVDHFERHRNFQALEASLVHLPISSLDLHQVLKLCRKHSLYEAILSIHARGMKDYLGPLEELLLTLKEALDNGEPLSNDLIVLGNKLLVYVSCCLSGLAYPVGVIPSEEERRQVKYEVFTCLTTLHSPNAPDEERAYPFLRTFLRFDTQAFLNVLSLAFEEPEFSSSESGLQRKQRTVDVLIKIILNGENADSTSIQMGYLSMFLARQLSLPPPTIVVSRDVLQKMIAHLCDSSSGDHTSREEGLLMLVNSRVDLGDQSVLLRMAEKAKFYRLCESLYMERGEYEQVLRCYIVDPRRRDQSFSLVRKELLRGERYHQTTHVVRKHFPDLVEIDTEKSARLALDFFAPILHDLLATLSDSADLEFKFLDAVVTTWPTVASASTSSVISSGPLSPYPPSDISAKYVRLLCHKNPSAVTPYLKSYEGYPLDHVLEIVESAGLVEATAYLLEKKGDTMASAKLLLDQVQSKLENLPSADSDLFFSQLESQLLLCIGLAQRSSPALSAKEKWDMWFPILEALLKPQHARNLSPRDMEGLRESTKFVITSMLGYVSLPAILSRVMKDPVYCKGQFGEVKDLIIGMISCYSYEETLLESTARLLRSEAGLSLAELSAVSQKGFSVPRDRCRICRKEIKKVGIVFSCGDCFHVPCLDAALPLPATGEGSSENGGVEPYCPMCRQQGHPARKFRPINRPPSKKVRRGSTTVMGNTVADEDDEVSTANLEVYLSRIRDLNPSISPLSVLSSLSGDAETKGLSDHVKQESVGLPELHTAAPAMVGYTLSP